MRRDFVVRVVPERDLEQADRVAAFSSFPKSWQEIPGNTRDRAWTRQEPAFRVVAHDCLGNFVGQIGLVELCEDPAVYGISDASVEDEWRRCGVASALLRSACEFSDMQGRQTMIATLNPGLRRVCERLGFFSLTNQVVLDGYSVIPESWMGRGSLRGAVINDLF